jgi:hypothetical protein
MNRDWTMKKKKGETEKRERKEGKKVGKGLTPKPCTNY